MADSYDDAAGDPYFASMPGFSYRLTLSADTVEGWDPVTGLSSCAGQTRIRNKGTRGGQLDHVVAAYRSKMGPMQSEMCDTACKECLHEQIVWARGSAGGSARRYRSKMEPMQGEPCDTVCKEILREQLRSAFDKPMKTDLEDSEIFSRGSKNHHQGQCRPCRAVFTPEGCPAGAQCNFCHFYHDDGKVIEAALFSARASMRRSQKGSGSFRRERRYPPQVMPPEVVPGRPPGLFTATDPDKSTGVTPYISEAASRVAWISL